MDRNSILTALEKDKSDRKITDIVIHCSATKLGGNEGGRRGDKELQTLFVP